MAIKKQSLSELNDLKKIPQKQIEEFKENGHTITRGLLSPEEVAAYHSVISNAALKYNTERKGKWKIAIHTEKHFCKL